MKQVFTARKRSLGQGNIFAPVCHSVHREGVPDTPPSPDLEQTPPQTWSRQPLGPGADTPPPPRDLEQTTPQTRYTPPSRADTPLGPGTTPRYRYTPLGPGTPPRSRPPGTRYPSVSENQPVRKASAACCNVKNASGFHHKSCLKSWPISLQNPTKDRINIRNT